MSDTPPGPEPQRAHGPPGPGWWLASDGRYYPPEQAPASQPAPPAFHPQSGPGSIRTNGMAIASLVLGLIWVCSIGSILALVFGYLARKQIDAAGGREAGRGLATAGIVLGWIGVATLVIALMGLFVFGGWDALNEIDSDPPDGVCNDDRWWQDPDCA